MQLRTYATTALAVILSFVLGACAEEPAPASAPQGAARTGSSALDLDQPLKPVQTLTLTQAALDDGFGWSVAMDGPWAVVGGYHRDVVGSDRGQAVLFHRDEQAADRWVPVATLAPPYLSNGDEFGYDVAIDGDLIVVGARQADGRAGDSGGAWVWRIDGPPGECIELQPSARTCEELSSWSQHGEACGESEASGSCPGTRTFASAEAYCAAAGARLCTIDEIQTNIPAATGCNYDYARIWSATPCGQGAYYTQAGNTIYLRDLPRQCTPATTTSVAVRCCADSAASPRRQDPTHCAPPPMTELPRLIASQGAANDELGVSVDVSGTTVLVGAASARNEGLASADAGAAYVFDAADPGEQCVEITASAATCETLGAGWLVRGAACGEADVGGVCSGARTYQDASAFCAAAGARLCSIEEIQADVVGGTGCSYDLQRIWSTTPCGENAYYTQAGVTTSLSTFPRQCTRTDAGGVYVRCCADAAASPLRTTPIRQCVPSQTRCTNVTPSATTCQTFGWTIKGTVCGESEVDGTSCSGERTQASAAAFCAASGARLCTIDEIQNDVPGSTGCNYDLARIWSSTPCDDGKFLTQAGVSANTGTIPRECTPADAAGVTTRCCADTATSPVRTTPFAQCVRLADTELARLEASDGDNAAERFGADVALDGSLAVVGATGGDGAVDDSGAGYVFDLTDLAQDEVRTELARLRASTGAGQDGAAGDMFGGAVALEGTRAVVGAAAGASGTRGDDNAGAAYLFDLGGLMGGESLEEDARLEASDGVVGDAFGGAVALDGDFVVVGGRGARGAGPGTGAAYVYDLRGGASGTLLESQKLSSGLTQPNARFGHSVAASLGSVVVGAPSQNGAVNGQGAAFIFSRAAVVTLSSSHAFIDEVGGVATLTFALDQPTTDTVTITFEVAGQATLGTDYTLEVAPVVIPAGESSATLPLVAVEDAMAEAAEDVIVTIRHVEGAIDAGAIERVRVVIADMDPVIQSDVYVIGRASVGNVLDVLANDTDPAMAPLTIVGVSAADAGGIVTIRNNRLIYTPDPALRGTETFTYTVSNGLRQRSAAVTISVPAFCSGASDLSGFGVVQEWQSVVGPADRASAVVADLDGDGTQEIVLESGDDINLSPTVDIYAGRNTSDANPVERITVEQNKMGNLVLADVDGNGSVEIIFFDSAYLIHVYTGYTAGVTPMTELVRATTPADTQPGANPGVGPGQLHAADLNQDGRPELISGNNVYAFLGSFSDPATLRLERVASGGTANPQGRAAASSANRNFNIGTTVAYDILPTNFCARCSGLELIAGPVIYAIDDNAMITPPADPLQAMTIAVDLNALMGVSNVYRDGPVAIADLDLDGLVDIAISGQKSGVGHGITSWNPTRGELRFTAVPNADDDTSGPIIANVFVDRHDPEMALQPLDAPEVILVSTSRISAVNVRKASPLWSVSTTDTSGSTGITVFDFNGDGLKEIVYRDENYLRVMYGGSSPFPPGVDASRNWTRFSGITSGTGHEQAIVADVDGDDEAEIVTTGAGRLRVFGRGGTAAWIPARKIWNQYNYFNLNIDDDLTVPRVQRSHIDILGAGLERPFNVFKEQTVPVTTNGAVAPGTIDPVTGLLFPPAAPDARISLSAVTYDGDCGTPQNRITAVYTVENLGDVDLLGTTRVAFYNGDPHLAGASLISTVPIGANIAPGGSRELTTVLADQGGAFDLYVNVNDRGTQTIPFEQPAFAQGECVLANNTDIRTLVCDEDTDDDGVDDDLDADSDNDGIPDLVELGGIDASGDDDGDNVWDWADPDQPGFIDLDNNGTDDRFDADGDGTPNHLDPDSDNDGILDIVENGGAALDADGDGRIDAMIDADGDGLYAAVDANDADPLDVGTLVEPADSDGDGIPDSLELDADDDGLFDIAESGQPDLNHDGLVDGFTDDDGDGLASTVDPSEGGQTIIPIDSDQDGTFDFQDLDDDEDGILTAIEVADSAHLMNPDVDGDGAPNWLDPDADGVDATDGVEGADDADGDGVPNYLDVDETDGPLGDLDEDGVPNGDDNCPLIPNTDQLNTDGDAFGDVCDGDDDGDGVLDGDDSCPLVPDAEQLDADDDGIGDVCDDDRDGDTVTNVDDSCPDDPNTDQLDTDSDGIGDVCDADDDGDLVEDDVDNCPLVANADQLDTDTDTAGDACDTDDDDDTVPDADDNCPLTSNTDQLDINDNGIGDACERDRDDDGVIDDDDNCPDTPNTDQANNDGDALGDVCDDDDDDDTVPDTADNCPLLANTDQANHDTDALGDACDDDDDGDGVLDLTDNCPIDANADQLDTDTDTNGDACDTDDDDDGVPDATDNCQTVVNTDQTNLDADALGDACDDDDDNDDVPDTSDNCLIDPNADQTDTDADTVGDICDPDDDDDTLLDGDDNCPLVANPDQLDTDGDLLGDACDDDIDDDGLSNVDELALGTDPADRDSDDDGVPDAEEGGEDGAPGDDLDGDELVNALDDDSDGDGILDGTELGLTEPGPDTDPDAGHFVPDADPATTTDPWSADTDGGTVIDGDEDANHDGAVDPGETDPNDPTDDVPSVVDNDDDGVVDESDNCPDVFNPDQADVNANGLGDACDADLIGQPCTAGVGACAVQGTLGLDPATGEVVCDAVPLPRGDELAEDALCDGVDNDCDGQADEDLQCADDDGDGVPAMLDNCPDASNADQADTDADGFGDACDNCPEAPNVDQGDFDEDGMGDTCDADVSSDVLLTEDCGCRQPGRSTPLDPRWLVLLALLGLTALWRRR